MKIITIKGRETAMLVMGMLIGFLVSMLGLWLHSILPSPVIILQTLFV